MNRLAAWVCFALAIILAALLPLAVWAQGPPAVDGNPPGIKFALSGELVAGQTRTMTIAGGDATWIAAATTTTYSIGEVTGAKCTPRYGAWDDANGNGVVDGDETTNVALSDSTDITSGSAAPNVTMTFQPGRPLVCYVARVRYGGVTQEGDTEDYDVLAGAALLWRIPRTVTTEDGTERGFGDGFRRELTEKTGGTVLVLLGTMATIFIVRMVAKSMPAALGVGIVFLVLTTIFLGASLWLLILILPLAGMIALTVKITR